MHDSRVNTPLALATPRRRHARAVADPAAALVGTRWGRRAYVANGERRTGEGSLAFCLAAFACVALPLGLFSPHSAVTVVGVAALLAVAVAGVEAVSPRGSDNLFIPLATYALLAAWSGSA